MGASCSSSSRSSSAAGPGGPGASSSPTSSSATASDPGPRHAHKADFARKTGILDLSGDGGVRGVPDWAVAMPLKVVVLSGCAGIRNHFPLAVADVFVGAVTIGGGEGEGGDGNSPPPPLPPTPLALKLQRLEMDGTGIEWPPAPRGGSSGGSSRGVRGAGAGLVAFSALKELSVCGAAAGAPPAGRKGAAKGPGKGLLRSLPLLPPSLLKLRAANNPLMGAFPLAEQCLMSLRAAKLEGDGALSSSPSSPSSPPGGGVCRAPHLRFLSVVDLSGCGLRGAALPACLVALAALQELRVDDNELTTLELLAGPALPDGEEGEGEGGERGGWAALPHLHTLSAARNRLTALPGVLPQALLEDTRLSVLRLEGNSELTVRWLMACAGYRAFEDRRAAMLSKGIAGGAMQERGLCGLD